MKKKQIKIETFSETTKQITREVLKRDGTQVHTRIIKTDTNKLNLEQETSFDYHWLRLSEKPKQNSYSSTKKLVDLFCGTGPMSLGVIEGGEALGIEVKPVLAIDFDKDSTINYALNFPESTVINDDINNIVDGNYGDKKTEKETELLRNIGKVDILIGGPPCQGHSDLNNHTRRNDKKNDLIFKVIRFAELTNPDHIIIENVQGIRHDKNNVVQTTKNQLKKLGYHITETLLMASEFGVAQNRRRFFLIATKNSNIIDFIPYKKESKTSFEWACNDLINHNENNTYNTSANHAKVNKERIEYLFKHDLHELPNHMRPKCHQDGNHSYNSVYGRMYFNLPSPTITGGFGSIGQGRFCHPLMKRSITPHEAARLQFIPDFFNFDNKIKRVSLQKLIGNAVPSKLTYLIALELLR